jgi:hypothetical protein
MILVALAAAAALAQQPPVPQPFPRPGSPATRPAEPRPAEPAPSQPPAPPAPEPTPQDTPPPASAAPAGSPDEAMLGTPIYPGAQFLTSYDAGRGQRFYIFGSQASFPDLVTYYRTVLRQRGDLLFEVPATHQFEVGRFREDSMAFPPGVTIKDYSGLSQGYPNPIPDGEPARFPTIIQIVPPPASER